MRGICTGGGFDVEGEVIGGEDFDPITGTCDLDSTFTVRCDDGALFQLHGSQIGETMPMKKSSRDLIAEVLRRDSDDRIDPGMSGAIAARSTKMEKWWTEAIPYQPIGSRDVVTDLPHVRIAMEAGTHSNLDQPSNFRNPAESAPIGDLDEVLLVAEGAVRGMLNSAVIANPSAYL